MGNYINKAISNNIKNEAILDNEDIQNKIKGGFISKTGKYFEIKKEDGSLVTLSSSEEIEIIINYSLMIITMYINKSMNSKTTEITINGFFDTIHKYEDHYDNYEKLTVDESKNIKFTQDISKNHLIFLKANPSTYFLDENGWNPSGIGTWNPTTRVAKLTKDITQMIEIKTNYVKLDGLRAGNIKSKIDGINLGMNGIYVNGYQNISISNIEILNCDNGILINNSDNISINNNVISSNNIGIIILDNNRSIDIKENLIKDNDDFGIYVQMYNTNIVMKKNSIINGEIGIFLNIYNNHNEIINNSIYKSGNTNGYFFGVFITVYNNYNLLADNSIKVSGINTANNTNITIASIYCNGAYNNYNNIENNSIEMDNNNINSNSNNLYGIYLGSSISGSQMIKNNKVSIHNNKMYMNNAVSRANSLWGVFVPFGQYVIENNKIYIIENEIIDNVITGAQISNIISGININNMNMGSSIKNNHVEMIKNRFTTDNTNVDTKIIGIYLFIGNYGSVVGENKIIVEENDTEGQSGCYGTYLGDSNTGIWIKSNLISINKNISTVQSGIYLALSNISNKIEGNRILNNQGNGIYLFISNRSNIIIKNFINDNEMNGIYFYQSNYGNRIENNYILTNKLDGIYFESSNNGNKILCNLIEYNQEYGVNIEEDNTDNVITGNDIISNNIGMYLGATSTDNRIQYNNFINGKDKNAYDDDSNYFNYNYWSDWDGNSPTYNKNGVIDDKPSLYEFYRCSIATKKPNYEYKPVKMPYKKYNRRYHTCQKELECKKDFEDKCHDIE